MEDPLLANMSQQRWERSQFRGIGGSQSKGVRRSSGCARISQHKLHDTHVSFYSSLLNIRESRGEHSQVHESSNGPSAYIGLRTHSARQQRSSSWSASNERMNAVSSVLSASW